MILDLNIYRLISFKRGMMIEVTTPKAALVLH